MKRLIISNSLILGMAFLLSSTAFAANKGSLQVRDRVSVNGQTLPVGTYTVKWEGNGPNVDLNVLDGKKVVATIPAHMTELRQSDLWDWTDVKKNDDGTLSLLEIHFHGKPYAFVLAGKQAKADTSK